MNPIADDLRLDVQFMARALELAQQGLWTTSPNPRVGSVVVLNGKIIGEGWHQRAGEPHAEVHALRAAGSLARGATAYVTLEPCSHTGRTPPCAEALIAAGVSKVVCAMEDPNPLVSGKGLAMLNAAGIETTTGILKAEAQELNIGFVSRMTRQRPWVRLKSAGSLDGRTALSNGVSQWITGPEARLDGHQWRARACAILTGINTVLADDPQMNVRGLNIERQPDRVILDSQLRTPPTARLFAQAVGKTFVITCAENPIKQSALEAAGAEVVHLPANANGQVDLHALMAWCNRQQFNEIHVEAGAALNGALLNAGLADELVQYLAPCLLGNTARGLFELPEYSTLESCIRLQLHDIKQIGPDIRIINRRDHALE
jgi:diaminohydroxyphosphoribosylaminopyrimidine deaminase / 5-amino-6-(5-phosphoribosylamino)uracil reductase